MKVLIIGRGRVGNGLRRSLRASRLEVATLGRSTQPSRIRKADVIVIAVPDDALQMVSERIAPHLAPRTPVVHCAGSRGLEELRACADRGAPTGVMHPLVSFPSAKKSPGLTGTTFTVSGAPAAIAASRKIASACRARVVVARTGDASYHAAAALAANGAAGLAFAAVSIFERLGFDRRAAERAIGGLLRTVGDNVESLGVPAALTGPIARGEAQTVARHRRALGRLGRGALGAYDAVLPVVVDCARASGLSRAKALAILRQRER